LLDEPTSSLDPDVADRVRLFLLETVKEEGTTVFLTSHNMAEVEKVCSRVVFLKDGKIQADGSPKELAWRLKRVTVKLTTRSPMSHFPNIAGINTVTATIEGNDVDIDVDRHDVGKLLTELVNMGIEIETLSTKDPTLEDFFVHSARQGSQ
jgi:ABC-2 type transport system ATP-binding protein